MSLFFRNFNAFHPRSTPSDKDIFGGLSALGIGDSDDSVLNLIVIEILNQLLNSSFPTFEKLKGRVVLVPHCQPRDGRKRKEKEKEKGRR
jgi:hypothetical protein